MEDVARFNLLFKWSSLVILIALSTIHLTAFAAKQGEVGTSSSQGSIAITLNIPESTQLRADIQASSLDKTSDLCLTLFNSRTQSSKEVAKQFYSIAGLKGNLPANYNVGLSDYQNDAQLIEFNHLHQNGKICNYQTKLESVNKHHSALLLMLIAE